MYHFQSIFIVEAFSNLLHEDNQAGWELLQQKDAGSQVLLNNAERYALYVAMSTTNTTGGIAVSKESIGEWYLLTVSWIHPARGPAYCIVLSPDPTFSRGEMVWQTKSNFLG